MLHFHKIRARQSFEEFLGLDVCLALLIHMYVNCYNLSYGLYNSKTC